MAEHDVEQTWNDFWVPLLDEAVEGIPLGKSVAIPGAYYEQIKRELHDFRTLVKDLPAFFDDITGGRCSKPNTDLDVVRELVVDRCHDWYDEGYSDWQISYDDGYSDGFEDGLKEARSRI